jgi:polygalacturonase
VERRKNLNHSRPLPYIHNAEPLLSRRTVAKGLGAAAFLSLTARASRAVGSAAQYNVRDFGAIGDGRTLDTTAIQAAIDRAANHGGGVVFMPAGTYPCFSLQLRSHVTIETAPGCVLVAATSEFKPGREYDPPEPQPTAISGYQDYGHNHWHNSLLWGEGLDQVAIVGPGLLWGRGLNKGDGPGEERAGAGNKIVALKNCRNVMLRDISMRDAGHFGVLASGVDNLLIDGVQIDTRRDGMDIDGCRSVHISNCTVNAPWDDGIVLKSSYSLGEIRPTERVTIDNCIVTGSFQMGSSLDGTFLPFPPVVTEDEPSLVGRIKIGTETNGDVRNVVVYNCVLDGCHGLAVESEDGGHVEDIRFSNITMRNLIGPPFFVRLGTRMRGPAGMTPGTIARIAFEGIDCWNATSEFCSVVSGVPGHPIRDISFANIRIEHQGGGRVRRGEVSELEREYPDPQMFGPTPAQGFFIRHVEGLRMEDIVVRSMTPDPRPLVVLDQVEKSRLWGVEGVDGTAMVVQGRRLSEVQVIDAEGKQQMIVPYQP